MRAIRYFHRRKRSISMNALRTINRRIRGLVFKDYKPIKMEVNEWGETEVINPKVEDACVIEVEPTSLLARELLKKTKPPRILVKSPNQSNKIKNLQTHATAVQSIKIKPASEYRPIPADGIKIEPAMENPPEQFEIDKQRYNVRAVLKYSNATPIRKHYVGSGYTCCFCKASFPIPADLKTHTVKDHDVETKQKFMKRIRLYSYIVKFDITSLSCNICNAAVDDIDQLIEHLNSAHHKGLHTDIKSYFACFKFHEDDTKFKCHICSAEYRSFKLLQEHMNKHCMNFICDECGAGCINRGQLKLHSAVHESGAHKCVICDKVFKSIVNLQSHTRQAHSKIPIHKCHLCDGRFKNKNTKRNHLKEAHGIVFADLECDSCNRTFKDNLGLWTHKNRDHLMERRYQCDLCDRIFFKSSMLKEHKVTHTGLREFRCEVCSKSYSRKHGLREHMRSHTGDRRFKCTYCGMAFLQKCSLKGHMRSRHDAELQ